MKKKLLLALSTWMLVLVTFASCSRSATDKDLFKYVPTDADMVVYFNVKDVVLNAGGAFDKQGITLPAEANQLFSTDEKEALNELNNTCKEWKVDFSKFVLFAKKNGPRNPLMIFKIQDKKQLLKQIEASGYTKQMSDNGLDYYTLSSDKKLPNEVVPRTMALDGKVVIFMQTGYRDNVEAFKDVINHDKAKEFSKSPFYDYVLKGNAIGAMVRGVGDLINNLPRQMMPLKAFLSRVAVTCFWGDLDGNELKITSRNFSEDGKPFDYKLFDGAMDINAKIDDDALKYFNEKQIYVSAISLKDVDWNALFNEVTANLQLPPAAFGAISVAKSYLDKLDGTVAFGLGVEEGLKSLVYLKEGEDVINQANATIVFETKDKQAQAILGDLKNFLTSLRLPVNGDENAFSVHFDEQTVGASPLTGGTLYAKADGNKLIISNREIKKYGNSPAVKSADFADYISAMAFSIDKNNSLMKDCGFNNTVNASFITDMKNNESVFKAEIKDSGAKGFLHAVIRYAVELRNNEAQIDEKYDKYRSELKPNYWDTPDYGYSVPQYPNGY